MLLKKIIPTVVLSTSFAFAKAPAKAEPQKAVAPAAESKKLDPNSEVTWKGSKEVGSSSHNGVVKIKDGSIAVDEKKSVIKSAELIIDMNSIENKDLPDQKDKEKLVGHLKSPDFFDVANHPTAVFKVKKESPIKNGKANLTGDLTMRGITHPVTINNVTIAKVGTKWTAQGSTKVNRVKWNVKYNSGTIPNPVKLAAEKIIKDDIELGFNVSTL